METTTSGAILAHFAARIAALTPRTQPFSRLFTFHGRALLRLRPWIADTGGNDAFRRFEIHRGKREDLGLNDPTTQLIAMPFTVRLAYPATPTPYGLEMRHELESFIETDATQIRDELESPSGLEGDAHQANLDVAIEVLDAADENHWFQDITLRAVFYTAKGS